MQFSFSEEQLALRDALRDLLAKECTPAHVRGAWTNETGRVPGLWEQLTAMGVTSIEEVATRSDLLDRGLIAWLRAIHEERRRSEAEIFEAFRRVRPQILEGDLPCVGGSQHTAIHL